MFLTVTSAGLVSLALVGQATGFSGVFPGFAITVLGVVLLVGTLTQVRVVNVAMEDLSHVLAMNRLRAAYTELDPGVVRYLATSRFDDRPGSVQTYYPLGKRSDVSHVAGSSTVFIVAVNSALVGLFLAGIAGTLAAGPVLALILGAIGGLTYLGVSLWTGGRSYLFWKTYAPVFPSPPPDEN